MMKERIKMIMDSEKMNPARFADSLEIGRAVISHILNGRNNPSLDVITRIIKHLPNINTEWLLSGNGNMYKQDPSSVKVTNKNSNSTSPTSPTLFSDNSIKSSENKDVPKSSKENVLNSSPNSTQVSLKEINSVSNLISKKIKQIIIYYTDNTFEVFQGDK